MERIDKILQSSLAKKGLLQTAKSSEVCFLADKWGNGRFNAVSFSRGVLKVSVSSSPAASELQIDEEKLIEFLNNKIGCLVKQLRIIVVNQRSEFNS